jgi:16S rRNA G966 N2-methylase RsmD
VKAPCTFQGGKQRLAPQIVDRLLEAAIDSDTRFYDLCCGSGAVSVELVNRGVAPSRIWMLDIGSWGAFWYAIGSGTFDMDAFDQILAGLPEDKHDYPSYLSALSALPIGEREAEIYPVLQAGSFGGKQVWRNGDRWANTSFRSYWEPTATSNRRSPVNPMQPSQAELRRRVADLARGMKGVTCIRGDIMTILCQSIPDNAVVYVDPPYQNTTGYGSTLDLPSFIRDFRAKHRAPLFVSEGKRLSDNATMLDFCSAKGGISGMRKRRHQEWLNRF